MKIRTRFAPSPTGYMHVGNLRTALYAYLLAKHDGGDFILRIEDTDQGRYVEGAVDLIYKALKDTGLKHDEGPDIGGPYGPYIQSERRALYKEYAEKLVELGGAYYCFCDKERLDSVREAQEAAKLHDEVFGDITAPNDTLDDNILLKSDGLPTYNFANVIDDHLMHITHVIRGSEYLSSTPKYNLLYEAFGWEIPKYVHCSPVMKEAGKKLSKREGDASYEDFLAKGYLKEAILNYICLLGWNPGDDREIMSLEEMVEAFSVKGISKSPAIFDVEKLNWMNGEYIRKLTLEEFNKEAEPYYKQAVKRNVDHMILSECLHDRTEKFSDIPAQLDFIDELPDYEIDLYTHKKMKTNPENSLESLERMLPVLESIDNWDGETIHENLFELIAEMGVKNGIVLWPLRVSLSGKAFTPGGGIELARLLGKDETLARVKKGIEKLK